MRWLKLFFVLLLVPLSACALGGRPATYLVDTSGPYTLDSGDVLRVTVYGDETLNKSYRVDDSGALSFPLVGPIKVRGRTAEQAAAAIAAGLANGYMRSPNVAAEIETYRPFFIQGAVKNAGQFTYIYGMTVRAAVSTAGGYADTANRSRAVIYRRQGNEMVKGSVALDYPIHPGDTIVIAESWL